MTSSHNGRAATRLAGATWIKSRHSGPTGGNCVEVAFLAGGESRCATHGTRTGRR